MPEYQLHTMKRSEGKKDYEVAENYFKNINSENKAYFLGLLAADGCNHKSAKIALQLKENDLYIIEKFKSEIGFDGPITSIQKKNKHYNISIYNRRFCQNLEVLGIVPRKTYKLNKLPDIPENLVKHFIRGVFDGDGCIRLVNFEKYGRSNKLRFCIAGNEPFLLEIQKVLVRELGLFTTKLSKFPNGKTRQLEYIGNSTCQKIYTYLYNEATTYLTRKKDIFNYICQ